MLNLWKLSVSIFYVHIAGFSVLICSKGKSSKKSCCYCSRFFLLLQWAPSTNWFEFFVVGVFAFPGKFWRLEIFYKSKSSFFLGEFMLWFGLCNIYNIINCIVVPTVNGNIASHYLKRMKDPNYSGSRRITFKCLEFLRTCLNNRRKQNHWQADRGLRPNFRAKVDS